MRRLLKGGCELPGSRPSRSPAAQAPETPPGPPCHNGHLFSDKFQNISVLPEKLNCLGIKVAGVSCGEARWIYQPTNEKEGRICPHIEPSHIAVKREEERPEATTVGFVHDLAHLLSQARC